MPGRRYIITGASRLCKKGSFITDYATLFVAVAIALGTVRLFMSRAVAGRMYDFICAVGLNEQADGSEPEGILEDSSVDGQKTSIRSDKYLSFEGGRVSVSINDHEDVDIMKNEITVRSSK